MHLSKLGKKKVYKKKTGLTENRSFEDNMRYLVHI